MTDQDEKLNQAAREFTKEGLINKIRAVVSDSFDMNNAERGLIRELTDKLLSYVRLDKTLEEQLKRANDSIQESKQKEIDRLKNLLKIKTSETGELRGPTNLETKYLELEAELEKEKQRAKGLASAARKFLKSNSGDWADNILEIEKALNNYSEGKVSDGR